MLGDLRGVFPAAESAPSVARFRPHRNLENQSKPHSHHPSASLHQKRENCSEENSHFRQWGGRMQLHVSHQKQAELVVVEIAAESFSV